MSARLISLLWENHHYSAPHIFSFYPQMMEWYHWVVAVAAPTALLASFWLCRRFARSSSDSYDVGKKGTLSSPPLHKEFYV
ncbi:unnamed protein product [Caenorhabditis auriculariae]|uniref:Uncharacterized protein n=1 Tax=Caenorhabditis auriculariae TaxID=2777116 RepID=A0A8S1H6N1_9PELO|nr:unnamed protein product [Caenorhabditis auriculariae]